MNSPSRRRRRRRSAATVWAVAKTLPKNLTADPPCKVSNGKGFGGTCPLASPCAQSYEMGKAIEQLECDLESFLSWMSGGLYLLSQGKPEVTTLTVEGDGKATESSGVRQVKSLSRLVSAKKIARHTTPARRLPACLASPRLATPRHATPCHARARPGRRRRRARACGTPMSVS